jgi:hypothetical protein
MLGNELYETGIQEPRIILVRFSLSYISIVQ